MRCGHCQGVFNYSLIDTSIMYNQDYFTNNYDSILPEQRKACRAYFRLIQKYKPGGCLLDYGCGSGVFLECAPLFQFTRNLGVDVSQEALLFAQKRVNPKDRLIHTRDSINGQFDLIAFVDSIAHIPDIHLILKKLIAQNLKNDGIIFIRTPRFNALYFLYARILSAVLPRKYQSRFYFFPQRFLLFHKKSMFQFLNSLNLDVLELQTQRDYSRKIPKGSLKYRLWIVMNKVILKFINPRNSMIIIAKLRRQNDGKVYCSSR